MSDLFHDFLVWLMGFTGCSVLIFAAACFARNQWKSRQKRVNGTQSAETDCSTPAADAQLSPKIKWLVFALAPLFYLLLLGPALSELHAHFQKTKRERAVLTQTAEISQTIEPIPDSIGTRSSFRIDYRISNNPLYQPGPCSCRKSDSQETPTQSAKPDVPLDSDESDWEVSPGWKLSIGEMNHVAEGDLAEISQDDQVD